MLLFSYRLAFCHSASAGARAGILSTMPWLGFYTLPSHPDVALTGAY